MHDSPHSAEETQWFIWNGTLGILDSVTIGEIEVSSSGRNAWLEEPYDMVGPFSLDELESNGQINFAACTVMSQQWWQENQKELRRQAHINRRASQQRMHEEFARYNERRGTRSNHFQLHSERQYRESLGLPIEGELKTAQIKSAYRRLAQKAHPDVGGSHEQFVRITKARDALLERIS